jgi:hypothetical protein
MHGGVSALNAAGLGKLWGSWAMDGLLRARGRAVIRIYSLNSRHIYRSKGEIEGVGVRRGKVERHSH